MSDQAKINAAINAAMGQIQKLAKGDRNQHGNYSFASVDAFLDMCRPTCTKPVSYTHLTLPTNREV